MEIRISNTSINKKNMTVNGDQIEDISGAGKTDEVRDYKLF